VPEKVKNYALRSDEYFILDHNHQIENVHGESEQNLLSSPHPNAAPALKSRT
jgi:hypothetical protein